MVKLKDNYTIVKWDGVNEEKVWFEEDINDAITELTEKLDDLYLLGLSELDIALNKKHINEKLGVKNKNNINKK